MDAREAPFALVKLIVSLSGGALVLVPTLLRDILAGRTWIWLLALPILLFAAALISGLTAFLVMTGVAMQVTVGKTAPAEHEKILVGALQFSFWSFVSGVGFLTLQIVASLFL
jgi:hypothetical protein